jgi:DNA replication protein DnaC
MATPDSGSLSIRLRSLRLSAFVEHHEEVALRAEHEGLGFSQCLGELVELELAGREERKVDRLRKRSKLPSDKTLVNLNEDRLTSKVKRQLHSLCEGGFAERAENVLAFGMPGRGKTHVVSAIGHELVARGISVLWRPACHLVQQLLVAKQELKLEAELRKLDRYDVLILDDIGYISQNREEMEVLFTLLAERYERRSVMITSNLVFSQWDRIFKDAMTTAAAIDRLVHHSVILEMTGESYRSGSAKKRQSEEVTSSAK